MKKGAVILLLGAVLTAGAASASEVAKSATNTATAKPAAARIEMAKGTITAIDAAKKTVTVKGTATWTFETAATTTFVANKKAGAWSNLKVGEKVSVHYTTKGTEHLASKIIVEG